LHDDQKVTFIERAAIAIENVAAATPAGSRNASVLGLVKIVLRDRNLIDHSAFTSPLRTPSEEESREWLRRVAEVAGTLAGPIAGSALVSLIERVVPSLLPPELRISEAILGVVFIAFVLFARQGMVGLGRLAWQRARSR